MKNLSMLWVALFATSFSVACDSPSSESSGPPFSPASPAPVSDGAAVPASYALGGTVSGLAGSGLVLANGDATASVSADGPFTFAKPSKSGSAYQVTVATQPHTPSQTCAVAKGAGTVGTHAVEDVAVTCTTNTYTVGGTVTGLAGSGLTLKMENGESLPIAASGAFTFPTALASGKSFAVSVLTQPTNKEQTCTVAGDHGTIGAANVSTVVVNCTTDGFAVGGTVSGLLGTVVLSSGGVDTSVTADGTFALGPVQDGAAYSVTVKTQPTNPWQTCVLTNGEGIVAAAAVTDLAISCTTNTYAVGAGIVGYTGSGLVLQNSGGDDLSVAATDAHVSFATPVASGGAYLVTVKTQPTSPSQTCAVTGSGGVVGGADASATVTCTTNTYPLSVTVAGLFANPVVLQNDNGDELTFAADGTQSFATAVASAASYNVTIKTPPGDIVCVVASGSGTVDSAGVTVDVTCANIFNDVDPASFAGFTQCFQNLYNAPGSTLAQDVSAACTKAKIVVGCRPVGAVNLTVGAQGARSDVFFDVGTGQTSTHDDAHGVSWYFTLSAGSSMGFAPLGTGVSRNSADTSNVSGQKRLSWHVGQSSGGYRCGATKGLNGSASWERLVYHAD